MNNTPRYGMFCSATSVTRRLIRGTVSGASVISGTMLLSLIPGSCYYLTYHDSFVNAATAEFPTVNLRPTRTCQHPRRVLHVVVMGYETYTEEGVTC